MLYPFVFRQGRPRSCAMLWLVEVRRDWGWWKRSSSGIKERMVAALLLLWLHRVLVDDTMRGEVFVGRPGRQRGALGYERCVDLMLPCTFDRQARTIKCQVALGASTVIVYSQQEPLALTKLSAFVAKSRTEYDSRSLAEHSLMHESDCRHVLCPSSTADSLEPPPSGAPSVCTSGHSLGANPFLESFCFSFMSCTSLGTARPACMLLEPVQRNLLPQAILS